MKLFAIRLLLAALFILIFYFAFSTPLVGTLLWTILCCYVVEPLVVEMLARAR